MTAVVAGGTGMIGSQLLRILSSDNEFEQIISLTRTRSNHDLPRVVQRVVNFNDVIGLEEAVGHADVIFSAVGTTNSKVKGDQDLYRSIDFDIPVNLANIGLRKGARQFVLVSAVGANSHSRNFYLRLKGEVEKAISILGYETVNILRPSLLLGDRQESRPLEKVSQVVMSGVSRFMAGSFRKYRPIHARNVARAMVASAKKWHAGQHVLEFDDMIALNGTPH